MWMVISGRFFIIVFACDIQNCLGNRLADRRFAFDSSGSSYPKHRVEQAAQAEQADSEGTNFFIVFD